MQYTISKGEKGKIEIKIDVSEADFREIYQQVLGQLAKDSKIAGFRPGHAPTDVVQQHIGLAKILNETASFLISKHLAEVFEKENLVPLGSPNIAIQSLAKDAPFSFIATLHQKPQVSIGDWKQIKLKKVKADKITDEQINESIKNIFEAYHKQQEDSLDKQVTGDKTEKDSGQFIYDVQGNKLFLEKSLRSSAAPAGLKIDDEFAKAVGARDLAHLKEIVKKDLETIMTDQVEAKFEDEVFAKILEMANIDLPDVLVEDELNRILVRLNANLEKDGLKLDGYLAEQKTTLDDLKAKWRPQAEKNVKITLIIDEIGKLEKIRVTREEIDEALKGINQANLSNEQKADIERYINVSIFQTKTLDLIKKNVIAF